MGARIAPIRSALTAKPVLASAHSLVVRLQGTNRRQIRRPTAFGRAEGMLERIDFTRISAARAGAGGFGRGITGDVVPG